MRDETSSEHYKIYRRGNTYTESVKPAGGRMSIDGVKQPVSGRIYGGGQNIYGANRPMSG